MCFFCNLEKILFHIFQSLTAKIDCQSCNKLKKFLYCFCFLFTLLCKGQSDLSISVHQDLRMLFVGDERGNGMFTPDILTKLEVDTFNFTNSKVIIYIGLEYADLVGSNFKRIIIGLGYIHEFSFLPKFNFGVLIDHGLILRNMGKFMGMSANLEMNYAVTKKLRASIIYQAIDRSDLTETYNTYKNIKGSVFLGLKIGL